MRREVISALQAAGGGLKKILDEASEHNMRRGGCFEIVNLEPLTPNPKPEAVNQNNKLGASWAKSVREVLL